MTDVTVMAADTGPGDRVSSVLDTGPTGPQGRCLKNPQGLSQSLGFGSLCSGWIVAWTELLERPTRASLSLPAFTSSSLHLSPQHSSWQASFPPQKPKPPPQNSNLLPSAPLSSPPTVPSSCRGPACLRAFASAVPCPWIRVQGSFSPVRSLLRHHPGNRPPPNTRLNAILSPHLGISFPIVARGQITFCT